MAYIFILFDYDLIKNIHDSTFYFNSIGYCYFI